MAATENTPMIQQATQWALEDLFKGQQPSQEDLTIIAATPAIAEKINGLCDALKEGGEPALRKAFNAFCKDIDLTNKATGEKRNWLRDLRNEEVPPRPGTEAKQERPKERKYQLQPLSYLKNKPRPTWAVDQMMFERGASLFVGDGGSGKSTLVLNMLISRACGVPFIGKETKPAFVVWVAAESVNELYPRIVACLACHDIPEDKFTNMLFLDGRVPFNNTAEIQAFIEETQEQLAELGVTSETYSINFAFDTYARCTPGSDENNTQETKLIADMILTISEAFNGHITVIHHTNAQGKIRGNTTLRDAVDTVWYVTKDGNTIKLSCDKMRGTSTPEPFSVEVRSIVIDEHNLGAPDSTAPVIFASNTPSEKFTPKVHLQMLKLLSEHNQLTSGEWQRLCKEKHEISPSSFYNYRKQLIANDLVNAPVEEEKEHGKKVYYSLSPKGVLLLG
jgi:hypothetical protein